MKIATWPQDAPRGAVARFCREHQISRSRFYEIRALSLERGQLEAVAPLAPVRRRLDLAIPAGLEQAALRIRKELADEGWDNGPISVRQRMLDQGLPRVPSRATLARLFVREGRVTPQPQKRPHSSWRRFTFKLVHECWQLDATEWALADGSPAVIFQLLDDHSRYIVGSWVDVGETSAGAVAVFTRASTTHQVPVLLLTDNGTAMNPHRRGVVSRLAAHAASMGTRAITSRVYHPQTVGKNERVHSTLKRWLRARPRSASIADLTDLVRVFDHRYNHDRPHQGLAMARPAEVLASHPWAVPPQPPEPKPTPSATRARRAQPVRTLTVNGTGSVNVSGLFIGLGVEYATSKVLAVVEATTISIFDTTGTHLRSVEITPGLRYYRTGRPQGGPRRPRLSATLSSNNSTVRSM